MKAVIRNEMNKDVKKQGMVAGVIYGNGLEPIKIKVERKEFHKFYEKNGQSAVFNCEINDGSHKVYIKDIQREILTPDKIMHFDLLRVSATDKIHAKIQILLEGKELIEKKGYIVQHNTTEIDAKYPISENPSDIIYDISKMLVGETIHLSDLNVPDYLEVQSDSDLVIVSISHPRVKLEDENENGESESVSAETV